MDYCSLHVGDLLGRLFFIVIELFLKRLKTEEKKYSRARSFSIPRIKIILFAQFFSLTEFNNFRIKSLYLRAFSAAYDR